VNHAKETIALDFFTVPTATFKVLFVLVILSHDRRRILHFNVTEHPTAVWTARQLLQACWPDEAHRYLVRDRDAIYGEVFRRQARALKIEDVPTAPQSPGMYGTHDRSGSRPSPSDPFELRRLLQPGTHASLLI
jgi:putative transposase